MKKKLVSFVLALSVSITAFAGCGTEKTTSETSDETVKDNSSNVSESDSDEMVDPGKLDAFAPYDEKVTVSIGFIEKSFIDYPEGDDVTNNKWTREYLERFNLEVVPAFVTDDGEYTTKLNLAIAEGNLPDVFYVSSSQLPELMEAGLLSDLTEAYENCASDNLKTIIEGDPGAIDYATGDDGGLYGIPKLGYGNMIKPKYVWIRKDWKEALNLEDPESLEDLVNIAKAFMENYGAEYGITENKSLDTLRQLAPAWGAYPTIWVDNETSGRIEYGMVQPEMKDALSAFATWYEEGVINRDFTTYTINETGEDIINGLTGIDVFEQGWGFMWGNSLVATQGNDSYFQAYEIPTVDGVELKIPVGADTTSYLVVSKDCENPEAALKMASFYDYAFSYMWDSDLLANEEEGMDLYYDVLTVEHAASTVQILDPADVYWECRRLFDYEETGDASIYPSDEVFHMQTDRLQLVKNGDMTNMGEYLGIVDEKCPQKLSIQYWENDSYIENKLWVEIPQSYTDYISLTDSILIEGFTKIIIGQEPLDYFDTLVQSWYDAGGEIMTNDINEIYGD